MMRVSVRLLVVCVVVVGWGVFGVGSAFGLSAWWHVGVSQRPASFAVGGEGMVVVLAANLGDAPTSGGVVLSDVLPAGLSVVESGGVPEVSTGKEPSSCGVVGRRVTCVIEEGRVLVPFKAFEMKIMVREGGVSGEVNEGLVSGGGVAGAQVQRPVLVGGDPVAFGVENYEVVPEEEGGGVDAQAGSHPFQLTTSFALNQTANQLAPPALPRNLQFKFPPGLVGNTTALPQCSELEFRKILSTENFCPADTVVGAVLLTFYEPVHFAEIETQAFPIFNLVPAVGEPARFGFTVVKTPVTIDTAVRTGSDYGVTATVSNTSQVVNFLSSTVVLWGAPGESSHDESRGWACLAAGENDSTLEPCPAGSGQTAPTPFLTLPTSCSTPFTSTVSGESWPRKPTPESSPSERTPVTFGEYGYSLKDAFDRALGMTGCNDLPFAPFIEDSPDVQSGSTPTGLKIDVRVPQEVSENAAGLASSSVKDITVAFPEGVGINPASANGLEACSEGQIGYTSTSGEGTDLFTPTLPNPFCPTASKVGTVKIKVPLIKNPLEGALYLAAQNANPFGSLLATYIVAEDPVSGILVKLAGEVTLNQETGQITSTFKNSPQAPLEDAEIHLFGGARAPFSTPAACGAYTTTATFAPWSGTQPVSSTSTFNITSGPNGSPCPPNPLPFAPTLESGTTNINAGAFSPLTTTLSREDGNQNIQAVQLHYPPGLLGILSGIKLCPEAQANAGTCPPESRLGSTVVSVGLGNEPFTVTGGEVFLTESYEGAPFGLSIVNPAVAGPFNLGKVIVRAKIELNPYTLALTVTTNNIPHILDGIPLQIKHVNVTIERPGFTFNPTNCDPMSITGTITSVAAATAPVDTPFQVTNCANLKFAPKFTVTTSGKTSKVDGASLNVKLAYPNAPQGTYANVAKVKVALPKALPSRLTTLQKACLAAVFETNPALCPPASIIGHAKVITPTLPVPLTGPAYFVSHGNEAFPSLTIVLQGYGITADLIGSTFIKNGITTTTFKTTPDAPFNTFELTLPQGKYSALAANTNLCKTKLTMPTNFTAQNGQQQNQNTKITVTNCPKPKPKPKHHTHTKTKH
jgi:uncharacterized repeat protein (TIGR01451 family)